jgi:glucokinase
MPAIRRAGTAAATPCLVADIGGTYARFAIAQQGVLHEIRRISVVHCQSAEDAIGAYLDSVALEALVERAAIAMAGPILDGHCRLTNWGWEIDSETLARRFGLQSVTLINDFAALAWALPRLEPTALRQVGHGSAVENAPVAVLGPGTGMGLAFVVPTSGGRHVVETEGGHAILPMHAPSADAVLCDLRGRFDHLSIERVLSGKGLVTLYEATARVAGARVPKREAHEIVQQALAGECETGVAALRLFCSLLGSVAGNVALTIGARGGVYIGGGIVPRFVDFLEKSDFRERFDGKGKMRPYLERIPAFVIMHPYPALVGLAAMIEDRVGQHVDQ